MLSLYINRVNVVKEVVQKQVAVELALRRVVHYISNKLAAKDDHGPRLCDMFGTYEAFKSYVSDASVRSKFLKQCHPREVEAAAFCKSAMEGGILIHSLLEETLETNWLQPAEIIMQNEGWRKHNLIDLEELLKDEDPVAHAVSEVKEAEVQQVMAANTAARDPAQIPADEMPEDATESALPPVPETSRSSYFKVAALPDWAEDLFRKVTLPTFEQSLAHAQTCANLSCCASS